MMAVFHVYIYIYIYSKCCPYFVDISKELYVDTMNGNGNGLISWHCRDCGAPDVEQPSTEDQSTSYLGQPALESTRLSEVRRTR